MAINELADIDLKELIEKETGQKFNKQNKLCCPFHQEETPSFSVHFESNANKEKFKCFGCSENGDAIDFIRKYKGLDYNQAREYLGLPVEKTDNEKQIDKIESYISWQIENQPSKKGFELKGIFPFVDRDNKSVYYKAKFLKPDGSKECSYYNIKGGKVINKRGSDELIYNLFNVLQGIKDNKIIVIVEGEKDANSVNAEFRDKYYIGTSVKNVKDLSQLRNANIYVCGDTGVAGEKYIQWIKMQLFQYSKVFKIISLPGLQDLGDNMDVTDWIQAGHTRNELLQAFKNSIDLKLDEYIKSYNYTNKGVVDRFINQYKDIIKYVIDRQVYIYWDGKRWIEDGGDRLGIYAARFVNEMISKIQKWLNESQLDDDVMKSYKGILKSLETLKSIDAIEKNYKKSECVGVSSKDLNKNIYYLNCNNGVVNLKTGELLPHDPKYYITQILPYNYHKGFYNKLYINAVHRLVDHNKEQSEALERILGYALSGKVNQKKFPLIVGSKDSGKSAIFEIMKDVAGDYAKTVSKDIFMRKWNGSGNNFELGELEGIRFVISSELSNGDFLNSELLKNLTGSDTISARKIYGKPFNFKPLFLPIMFTNELPSFDGADDALVSRLIIIHAQPLKPEEINRNFNDDVKQDCDGIISYLIDCAIDFYKHNALIIPGEWKDNTDQYQYDNNPYKQFCEETLILKNGYAEYTKEVYKAFDKWYRDGISQNVPTPKRLTLELNKIGIKHTRRNGAVYLDVMLKPEWRLWGYGSYYANDNNCFS